MCFSRCYLCNLSLPILCSQGSPGLGGCFAGSFLYYVVTIITPRLELLFGWVFLGQGSHQSDPANTRRTKMSPLSCRWGETHCRSLSFCLAIFHRSHCDKSCCLSFFLIHSLYAPGRASLASTIIKAKSYTWDIVCTQQILI